MITLLQLFFQLSRVGFVFIQMSITTWKQGKNLLNCLKSLQVALRTVIWWWIQITLHKSLHWLKIVIVWPSGCCFPSKCRAPHKNKAKIPLMILKAGLQFLASTFGYCINLLIFKWTDESFGNSPFNYWQSQLQGLVLNPGGGPAQIAPPPLNLEEMPIWSCQVEINITSCCLH